jgi:hypothetical protein
MLGCGALASEQTWYYWQPRQISSWSTARGRGCPWEELSNQWLDWDDMMLPQLIDAGALTPDIEQTANEITESLRKYCQEVGDEIRQVGHTGPYQKQFSERALSEDDRWEHIRNLAKKALTDLYELGVIGRTLTDPDYNTAVIEPHL